MNQCYAVSLRNNTMDKSMGPLSNCRSILQEIIWMLDNWDNVIRPYHINKRIEEIISSEEALYSVKDHIWRSCLSMCSKYDTLSKQDGRQNRVPSGVTSARTLSTNTEVVVRENSNVPIAIHQREAAKTVMSPQLQPLKNLLVDWSVFLNPNYQLCVVGSLPNDGSWETSPISTRISPTTIKTISGTIYNINGPMVIPEDIDIPNFVKEKFCYGFPEDWKTVATQWIHKAKNKKVEHSGPRSKTENLAQLAIRNSNKETVPVQNPSVQQQDQFSLPPPKENMRKQLPDDSTLSTASRVQPPPNVKKSRAEKLEGGAGCNVSSVLPRYSKRILSKSRMDSSCVSQVDDKENESVDDDDVRYLRDWHVEYSRQTGGLVLRGRLINKEGMILRSDFTSENISRRILADLVETADGQPYRLVGTAFGGYREFNFGFPPHWQNLIEKFKNIRRTCLRSSQGRRSAAQPSTSRADNRQNASKLAKSNSEVMRHGNLINQMLKHQLSKAQPSGSNGKNNGTFGSKNTIISGKRKNESENVAPIKKMRPGSSQESEEMHNNSMDNKSMAEIEQKKQGIQKMQSDLNMNIGTRKTSAIGQGKHKGSETVNPAKPSKSVNPQPKDSRDEYSVGLEAEDFESENDFNIF